MTRRLIHAAIPAVLCLALTGCSFDGVQSVTLPGGKGTGDDALKVTIDIPDVGTLTPNAEVKVDDVAVGTVTDLRVVDWHARAEVSLEDDVVLPADATARVGVNSLLGSSFIELAAPEAGGTGSLRSGDHIPLDRSASYPATEQVLASASVVLNGGGLEQLATITKELDHAFSGNDLAVRDLLPRVESFVSALNAQRGDIVSAIENVDRLAARLSGGRSTITRALDELGPALKALSEERPDLTRALDALRQLGDVSRPLIEAARTDLTANLRDLVPALRALTKAGDSLAKGLGYAVTFPFPTETVENTCPSDYCNLFLTLDLTADELEKGLITPGGQLALPGIPGLPPGLLGTLGGVLGLPILGLLGAPATATGSRDGATTTPGSSTTDGTSGGTNPLGGLLGTLFPQLGTGGAP